MTTGSAQGAVAAVPLHRGGRRAGGVEGRTGARDSAGRPSASTRLGPDPPISRTLSPSRPGVPPPCIQLTLESWGGEGTAELRQSLAQATSPLVVGCRRVLEPSGLCREQTYP